MSQLIVIPRAHHDHEGVIPLAIESTDRSGNPLDDRLLDEGIEPMRGFLIQCALKYLGDGSRASELAQATARRVAGQREFRDHTHPPRVLVASAARDIARRWNADQRRRQARLIPLRSEDAGAGPDTLEAHVEAKRIIERMRRKMDATQNLILDLFLLGMSAQEIVDELKRQDPPIHKTRGALDSMIKYRARQAAETLGKIDTSALLNDSSNKPAPSSSKSSARTRTRNGKDAPAKNR